MSSELLKTVDRIQEAFQGRLMLHRPQLEDLAEDDTELLGRCLDFMLDRDAILIVGDGGAVYHHGNSVEAVFEKIRELGRTTPAAINESLNLPSAITCEILGWLERDGRVQLEDDTNHVSVA